MAVTADNYAKEKLEAWKYVSEKNAQAISNIKLPTYLVINGSGSNHSNSTGGGGAAMGIEMANFMNLLMMKAAKDLDVDPKPIQK